jgi:hypothetical protein
MFAMVAGPIGNPEPFEQSSQHITARQGDRDERQADREMLAERGIETEPWEHHHLRGDGQAVADDDIRDRLDQ